MNTWRLGFRGGEGREEECEFGGRDGGKGVGGGGGHGGSSGGEGCYEKGGKDGGDFCLRDRFVILKRQRFS